MGMDPISMGLIADVAAPALSSILGPILQNVGQSLGAQGGQQAGGPQGAQQAGGLQQVAQEAEQLIQQFMKIFGGMGQQGGTPPGMCPQSPFPFSPGASGISSGTYDNPSQYLQGDPGFTVRGSQGTQNIDPGFSVGSSSSSNSGGLSSLSNQYNSVQQELQSAEASGNPAQIAQAQQDEEKVMNAINMISAMNQAQSQAISKIISAIGQA